MSATTDPVLQAVEVEADEFLIVDVGEGVVGAQLLDVFSISCPFIVSCYYAVKRPVGLFVTSQSKPDDNVAAMVSLQEQ